MAGSQALIWAGELDLGSRFECVANVTVVTKAYRLCNR